MGLAMPDSIDEPGLHGLLGQRGGRAPVDKDHIKCPSFQGLHMIPQLENRKSVRLRWLGQLSPVVEGQVLVSWEAQQLVQL